MAEIRHFRASGSGAARQNALHKVAPPLDSAASQERYCVYNQTRERFVATDVEAAHASPDGAEARLRALEPGVGTGLWVLPYLEISPTSIRFPLDLIFLNSDCVVLATVESFPLASLPASSAKVLSMLALPADTLAKGEMRVGDQLIISEPGEMKQHLQRLKEGKAEAHSSLGSFLEPLAITSTEEHPPGAIEEPPQTAVDAGPAAPIEAAPVNAEIAGGEAAGAEEHAASSPTETNLWKNRLGSRNWLAQLLRRDPVDPRKAQREALPGLIAYFFTGGTPAAHEVRDMSATGVYIVTKERWYPGTVVRVTLTDRHRPTDDRTITVNAKAVRWGSDGVGLEFILEKEDQQGIDIAQLLEQTLGVNHARVQAFLQKLKAPSSQE
jgi:hypothetical protein